MCFTWFVSKESLLAEVMATGTPGGVQASLGLPSTIGVKLFFICQVGKLTHLGNFCGQKLGKFIF